MKRTYWRRLTYGAIGLAILALLIYGFMPKPAEVDIGHVTRGDLQVTVDEDGKTRIRERYVVASPLDAQLLRIPHKPGADVYAGQTVLATLEPSDPKLLDDRARAEARAKVESAKSALERAKAKRDRAEVEFKHTAADLLRARTLLQGNNISEQDFDKILFAERSATEELAVSKFDVKIAEFELELARAALLRSLPRSELDAESYRIDIRSPINGRVLRVFQESAVAANAGMKLLEVGDPTDLEVEVDVLSSDAVKIPPNARVYLEHWGGSEKIHGQVRLIEPAAFTKVSALGVEEQRVWVIIRFTDPAEKWQALGDAYRVEARIIIWEGKDVLQVPAGALFRRGDRWAVFVMHDGRAKLREVEVGRSNGLFTQVLSGLDEGDTVVVHPSDKIADGAAIRPRE